MALGFLSRRESRKDLRPRLITLLLLYFMLLYSLLLLQDGGLEKKLVFDRLGLPPPFSSGILQPSPHIQPSFDNVAYVV